MLIRIAFSCCECKFPWVKMSQLIGLADYSADNRLFFNNQKSANYKRIIGCLPIIYEFYISYEKISNASCVCCFSTVLHPTVFMTTE